MYIYPFTTFKLAKLNFKPIEQHKATNHTNKHQKHGIMSCQDSKRKENLSFTIIAVKNEENEKERGKWK